MLGMRVFFMKLVGAMENPPFGDTGAMLVWPN